MGPVGPTGSSWLYRPEGGSRTWVQPHLAQVVQPHIRLEDVNNPKSFQHQKRGNTTVAEGRCSCSITGKREKSQIQTIRKKHIFVMLQEQEFT